MNLIQWISFFCFILAAVLAFLPRVDHRATIVLLALGGALLVLDVAGVIEVD